MKNLKCLRTLNKTTTTSLHEYLPLMLVVDSFGTKQKTRSKILEILIRITACDYQITLKKDNWVNKCYLIAHGLIY